MQRPADPDDAPGTRLLRSRRPLYIGLGLVLLTLVTFLPALEHGFVNYDDPVYVTENSYVRAGLSAAGVAWAFSAFVSSNYHPVTVLSHMLDGELFGLNPRGHHLTSLLIHLVNAVLVFVVLRRMTDALWPSAFVAALFAVHPLRVEPVAWIADRKDLLSAFFSLLALAAYLAYSRRPSWTRYLAVVAAALLGLLAKATAVTLPCVLLLLDVWPLGRVPRSSWLDAARSLPRLLLEKLPLFALSAAAGYLAVVAQGQAWMPVEALSFPHRAANAAVSYVTYLMKTVAPHDMAVFYPHVAIPAGRALFAAAFLAAVTVAALATWRRFPYLAVGWLWFVGTLAPVIGLTQVGNQAMADRYTYVAGLGLLIATVWSLVAATERSVLLRRLLVVAGVGAVLVLPFLTRVQLRHWHSSVTLFSHALEVTPPNVVAHLNLAEGLRQEQRPEEAARHYQAALALEPTRGEAYAGLAAMLLAEGRLAAGIGMLEKAVELSPHDPRLHHGLAAALDTAGRLEEAIAHLEKAVELRPEMAAAHLGLASLYQKTGDTERARVHMERAMALGRGPHSGRGTVQ